MSNPYQSPLTQSTPESHTVEKSNSVRLGFFVIPPFLILSLGSAAAILLGRIGINAGENSYYLALFLQGLVLLLPVALILAAICGWITRIRKRESSLHVFSWSFLTAAPSVIAFIFLISSRYIAENLLVPVAILMVLSQYAILGFLASRFLANSRPFIYSGIACASVGVSLAILELIGRMIDR